MLDIIYASSVYDFGFNFGQFNEISYILPLMMTEKTKNVASWYDKRIASVQKHYDKIVDAAIANANTDG